MKWIIETGNGFYVSDPRDDKFQSSFTMKEQCAYRFDTKEVAERYKHLGVVVPITDASVEIEALRQQMRDDVAWLKNQLAGIDT